MEGLTRLVSESLARHGFDRPVDYRRLHWSRWFRCDSPHSLLFVPSKPGVFALAEEIMDLDSSTGQVGTPAPGSPAKRNSASPWEGHDFIRAKEGSYQGTASAVPFDGQDRSAAAAEGRRMLAVTQFFEADDMAFVLDRMLSQPNPMRDRLASGRYFVRFVVIEDQSQRRTISNALNQWMVSAAEKATGIGSNFATSLELTEGKANGVPQVSPPLRDLGVPGAATPIFPITAPQQDSGAATNIHCPAPFPSGF